MSTALWSGQIVYLATDIANSQLREKRLLGIGTKYQVHCTGKNQQAQDMSRLQLHPHGIHMINWRSMAIPSRYMTRDTHSARLADSA